MTALLEPVRRRRAAAFFGSAALVVAAAGIAFVVVQEPAGAKTSSNGTVSAAAKKPAPVPTQPGNGNGNGGGNNGNGVGNGPNGAQPSGKALTVSATAGSSLAPGVSAPLTVTITNPNNQAVNIVSAGATISSVGTKTLPGLPPCDLAWLTVSSFSGSKSLAAGATTTIPLTVSFVNLAGTNQDNCKGVEYTFSLTATANQA